ncbi:hypothetical protein HK101_001495 [Irineochytrium annulatum]|nr:hypothetical protein HK101_001495 [Irineochytrium annulatum]
MTRNEDSPLQRDFAIVPEFTVIDDRTTRLTVWGTFSLYLIGVLCAISTNVLAWYHVHHSSAGDLYYTYWKVTSCEPDKPCQAMDAPCVSYGGITRGSEMESTCSEWKAVQAFMVLSGIVGFLGCGAFLYIIVKGVDNKRVVYATLGSAALVAFFQFINMCLGANIKGGAPFLTGDAVGKDATVTYGAGLSFSVVSWLTSCGAALGVPVIYKALKY